MLGHKTSLNKLRKLNRFKHLLWPLWFETRNQPQTAGGKLLKNKVLEAK